jgi:hypothetical protein
MARIKDKRLFAFLKDRKIFTSGGHRTLREYMNAQEVKTENADRARKGFKKARYK